MSKLGILFLLLTSVTLAWAGPGAQGDDKGQPCKVTTKAESHPCTAAEEAALIAKQRQALEAYQPHASGQPYTVEEQRRLLLRLLGPGVSPAAVPSRDERSAESASEKLQRTLHDAAGSSGAAGKSKSPKQ